MPTGIVRLHRVLRAKPDKIYRAFIEPDAIGVTGALVKMPDVASGGNSVIVYFMCADCAVTAAKAEEAGGRIHMPKTSIGQYGHIALVTDTEGNTIGLHSMT